MLPIFYQTFLQKYLTRSQLITLKMLVWLLQGQKQVRIERRFSDTTVTNTTEQLTATFTTIFKSECFKCSTAMVSHH